MAERAGADEKARGQNVVLVGMMGAGKSTVAKLVASRLGWPVVDTDEMVEERVGTTIAEMFAASGEVAFRDAESAAIFELAAAPGPFVASLGGGAVVRASNRDVLRSVGFVVWLRAGPDALVRRVGSGDSRPLLGGATGRERHGRLAELARTREAFYREVADLVIDVEALSAEEVATLICGEVEARGAAEHRN